MKILLTNDDGYRKLLQIIGHEYFHQWNIRRLRPKEYVTYNYTKAIISEGLWFAEGVTSYFDLAIPMIAGITSPDDFLIDLSNDITSILNTPGRHIHSLSDSSKEAWVKLYNSTPASKESQINYYKFGTILSLCLDIKLRLYESSLAELLRNLYQKFNNNCKQLGIIARSVCRGLNFVDTFDTFDTKKNNNIATVNIDQF